MTQDILQEEWEKLKDNPYFLNDFKLPVNIGNFKLNSFVNYLESSNSENDFLNISYRYSYDKSNYLYSYITIYIYSNKQNSYILPIELNNHFLQLIRDLQNSVINNKKIGEFKNISRLADINGFLYSIYSAEALSFIKRGNEDSFSGIEEDRIYLWSYKNYFIKVRYSKSVMIGYKDFYRFFEFIDYLIENKIEASSNKE